MARREAAANQGAAGYICRCCYGRGGAADQWGRSREARGDAIAAGWREQRVAVFVTSGGRELLQRWGGQLDLSSARTRPSRFWEGRGQPVPFLPPNQLGFTPGPLAGGDQRKRVHNPSEHCWFEHKTSTTKELTLHVRPTRIKGGSGSQHTHAPTAAGGRVLIHN